MPTRQSLPRVIDSANGIPALRVFRARVTTEPGTHPSMAHPQNVFGVNALRPTQEQHLVADAQVYESGGDQFGRHRDGAVEHILDTKEQYYIDAKE